MRLIGPLSTVGLLLGTLFFAFSLTPSLVPRPFAFQGVLSGLSLTAGYAIGAGLSTLWHYLQLPELRGRLERIVRWLAVAGCALVAVIFMWRAAGWQDAVRAQMELEPAGGLPPVGAALVALLVFAAALLLARLFRGTFRFLSLRLQRYIPPRVSHLAGIVVAVGLFWAVIDGVLFTMALRAADSSYQQVDALIEADQERPSEPERAGSPDSVVAWRDLGRQGRSFVSSGPTATELKAFLGEPAPTPIRIYIGLNAAETPEERAQLAMDELHRTDAFDRSVLVLATPTGTGWIDPAAADPVEYLHRGDIATVTAQYSYLPSPLALMVEGSYGAEMARALFEAVYGHWQTLPEDERPALYLHGLSLGALNSDRAFDVFDIIQDPFDGALWSGPPFRSETWRTVTQRRDAGSPAWLPEFREGEVVRFMNQETGLDAANGDWGTFRLAFLQYASDPITFFSPSILYREPDWMAEPRGPDVTSELRWYPVVTMLQLAADMAAGGAPPGYGHTYAAEDYIDAWVALTEPDDWSRDDLKRLRQAFRR
ncbi:alpha/beta hydrolase [Halorhodospira halophila]|uniref:Uncharacterized protein n=1 Tax=Halorhodospira halophila (strain DSM 244 / SL1) TaxID=349124 RepID=A1WT67_HALHL|nr:alpha/beta-hydrolase family protein [Halorhodospira halophila]ABM60879.1 conserved hypothetical protein [Halorhodospira halophila SL1]MBK1728534.1 hypothetical protein [Halorhodospira halophila]